MGLTIQHFFPQNTDQDAGTPFYSASVQITELFFFKESNKQERQFNAIPSDIVFVAYYKEIALSLIHI